MEHTLPSLRLDEPWRTRAIVAAALALIELVVILGVVLLLVGRPISERVSAAAEARVLAPAKPAKKPKKKTKPAQALPKLERGETSVMVLNGNGETGAAHAESARVRQLGYLIGTVGNAPRNDFPHSLVMYRPGHKPEALRLAKDLRIRNVTPLDGLSQKDLLGAHLAYVLGG
jgi:hypothetical protein